MFELIQLRCFVAVAEELHFGRAALRLNMSQPPLSRHIQVLERILQVQLFNRSSRSVRLTASGKAFLPEAQRIVHMADSALVTARAAAAGQQGLVTIGFTAASLYRYVPALIGALQAQLPDVQMLLRESVSGDLVEGLLRDSLDLAILRPPVRREGFACRHIASEPLVVCSPASVPPEERPRRLGDFDGRPFVMYSPDKSRYFHELVAGLLTSAGAQPSVTQHLTQIHSILVMVGAGHGFALVPESACQLRPVGVEFSPLEDVGPVVELYAAWRADHANPALTPVLQVIDQQLAARGGLSPAP
ncbi:LysR family transcriptional regulator [Novosphingobium sp. FSY-8]|uniref:LysR family transcriptional regulator n=1 Tax=Novosphingobium ovatum TaxID=1908523 RepID=A0ABW9X9X6_9SPHN|nr:LysR family transcriptional regulator [Novosphingobium ovatum]NBC35339.1 LysR family transcriptional regulator [Novosphingobium ovatum]